MPLQWYILSKTALTIYLKLVFSSHAIHRHAHRLIVDLQETGPVQTRWPHYGKIRGKEGVHHCHLNKGKPRYVAVWRESKEQLELLEIRYVGTHENADYSRID